MTPPRVENIGKYHVQKVLGHGGMGTVYEALDPLIQRKVALKTMIPGLADAPELRMRFLREAQAAGGLHHRNIVTVYDLGEDHGRPFIAMELVEGSDLEKIIQRKEELSVEWKLDVVRQICEGLSYAHKSGIVHRDVKPANIRVTPEGEVKIVDFGIAHLQSSKLTKSGLVLGSVHYMAPEQIEGHRVDQRADIFSVGAIAFELLAYRKPFESDSLTGVMFKVTHEPPDASALPASVFSPGLERIVLKAMARDVADRYQNLDEMLADLQALVRETAPRLAAGADADPSQTVMIPTLDVEREEMQRRAGRCVEDGRRALGAGALDSALAAAREALELVPDEAAARRLLLDVESEQLRQRVESELSALRGEMQEAHRQGHLPRALSLCRRLQELNPDDPDVAAAAREIEASIRSQEVEQLSGQALAYAADGEMELALKIAARVEKLDSDGARARELRRYLGEEARRREADALTAEAQEHLAHGALEQAMAAALRALGTYPAHALAREISDRASKVLARRERHAPEVAAADPAAAGGPAAPDAPATPPPAQAGVASSAASEEAPGPPAEPASEISQAAPVVPGAPTVLAGRSDPLPSSGVTAAAAPRAEPRGAVTTATPPPLAEARESTPSPPAMPGLGPVPELAIDASPAPAPEAVEPVLVLVSPAAGPGPAPEAPVRADAGALAEAALRHFLRNEYGAARKAAEKALGLEPRNKKARELMKILSSLG